MHNEYPAETSSSPELTFIVVGIGAVGLVHLLGFEDFGIALTIVGIAVAFLVLHFKGIASNIPNDWQRWKAASPSLRAGQPK